MSGSLAIISKRVGLDRVLSGGGDIGFKRPAVRAELNLLKLEGNAESDEWPWFAGGGVAVCVKSMTGDRLPGEKRILNDEGESGVRVGSGSVTRGRRCLCGGGGGGEGRGKGLEAGQHQEFSGETTVGGSRCRLG